MNEWMNLLVTFFLLFECKLRCLYTEWSTYVINVVYVSLPKGALLPSCNCMFNYFFKSPLIVRPSRLSRLTLSSNTLNDSLLKLSFGCTKAVVTNRSPSLLHPGHTTIRRLQQKEQGIPRMQRKQRFFIPLFWGFLGKTGTWTLGNLGFAGLFKPWLPLHSSMSSESGLWARGIVGSYSDLVFFLAGILTKRLPGPHRRS